MLAIVLARSLGGMLEEASEEPRNGHILLSIVKN